MVSAVSPRQPPSQLSASVGQLTPGMGGYAKKNRVLLGLDLCLSCGIVRQPHFIV
jgi:hypothetical protein